MKLVVKLLIVAFTLSFAACSTVAGAGKDITSAAEWTKEKLGGSK